MTNPNALLHRRDVVNELVRDRADLLVIAGLGAPNWDVSAAGDHPNNFPLWGAMGGASTAMDASEPIFINISPSPVITITLRFGCASASPSPIMEAAPIAPQSGKLLG